MEVQARGRLVQDVERAAGGAARQFLAELHALGLAARQGGGLLADGDVAQPHALEGFELLGDGGYRLEQFGAGLHRHVQHVADRPVAEFHVQRFAVVALALADIALDVNVRQEMHLDLDDAVALAGFAAPALDVEAEAAGGIAARLGLGQFGKPVANGGEGAGIGGRIGARSAPDRALVDVDHLVEEFQPLDAVMGGGVLARLGELARRRLVERLDGEGGFAAARDAGDAGQRAERDLGGDVLEVVAARANDLQPPVVHGLAPLFRHGDEFLALEIFAGQAFLAGHDVVRRAFGNDVAAVNARARTHVDHMVGLADGILVMLDHQHGVAHVAQALE